MPKEPSSREGLIHFCKRSNHFAAASKKRLDSFLREIAITRLTLLKGPTVISIGSCKVVIYIACSLLQVVSLGMLYCLFTSTEDLGIARSEEE